MQGKEILEQVCTLLSCIIIKLAVCDVRLLSYMTDDAMAAFSLNKKAQDMQFRWSVRFETTVYSLKDGHLRDAPTVLLKISVCLTESLGNVTPYTYVF